MHIGKTATIGIAVWVAAAAAVFAATWNVGDKARYYDAGWWDVTIVEAGVGDRSGQYLVKDDKYLSEGWIAEASLEARPAPPPSTEGVKPRTGVYVVRGYGNPSNPLPLGRITLLDGNYRWETEGGELTGAGEYEFADAKVNWLTGILKEKDFTGRFEIKRDGREHQIWLNRATMALNYE